MGHGASPARAPQRARIDDRIVRSSIYTAFAVLALAGLALDANAASLLGYETFPNVLYDVAPTTGAAFNPRSLDTQGTVVGIAFDNYGVLYGLTTRSNLIKVDPATGMTSIVGRTSLGLLFEGDLVYDPFTDTLFGAAEVPTGDEDDGTFLFTLNRATAQSTRVGDMHAVDVSALAIDAQGRLLALDTQLNQLFYLDKTTGSVLTSAVLSVNLGSTAGMAFEPGTGRLLVADGNYQGTNRFYELDPATGVLSEIGEIGTVNGLAALTFAPIPEPGTGALLALGLVAITRGRRPA